MSASASGGENDQDFEINLAPIIDCFTVLITYLLVSASFISLSSLDIHVATASEQPPAESTPPPEPEAMMYVELAPNWDLRVLLVGGKNPANILIPAKKGAAAGASAWDLDKAAQAIQSLKTVAPNIGEVNLKADPELKYSHVVQVIESLKNVVPKVFLGE